VRLGYACGFVRGVISALVSLMTKILQTHDSGKVTNFSTSLAEACSLRDRLSVILAGIAEAGSEDTEKGPVMIMNHETMSLREEAPLGMERKVDVASACQSLAAAIQSTLCILQAVDAKTLCENISEREGCAGRHPWGSLLKRLDDISDWVDLQRTS